MEHNNGHWFPVGVLLAGVLSGSYLALKTLIGDSAGPAMERAPDFVLAIALILCSGAFAFWWRENH